MFVDDELNDESARLERPEPDSPDTGPVVIPDDEDDDPSPIAVPTPFSPPSGPAQRLFQGPPSEANS